MYGNVLLWLSIAKSSFGLMQYNMVQLSLGIVKYDLVL